MQMNYEPRTMFKEKEASDVKRFAVVEVDGDWYRVAEKWLRADADDTWTDYWVPEAELSERVDAGACTPDGRLNSTQFEQLVDAAGLNPDRIDTV